MDIGFCNQHYIGLFLTSTLCQKSPSFPFLTIVTLLLVQARREAPTENTIEHSLEHVLHLSVDTYFLVLVCKGLSTFCLTRPALREVKS